MKTIFCLTGIAVILVAFQDKQKFDLKASIERGKDIYITQCLTCHMEKGEGIEGLYPPLAKSDYLMANKKRAVEQVLHGVSGEMKVNGIMYNGEMQAFDHLTDQEVSDVLNYIRNSWGNKGEPVRAEEVKALRR